RTSAHSYDEIEGTFVALPNMAVRSYVLVIVINRIVCDRARVAHSSPFSPLPTSIDFISLISFSLLSATRFMQS
ncbi:hypothetical protein PFISCL1PPCAC_25787, partial [Pristionchus fissidentatus]